MGAYPGVGAYPGYYGIFDCVYMQSKLHVKCRPSSFRSCDMLPYSFGELVPPVKLCVRACVCAYVHACVRACVRACMRACL